MYEKKSKRNYLIYNKNSINSIFNVGLLQHNIITQLTGSPGENVRPIESYEDYAGCAPIIDGCNLFKCHDGTIIKNGDQVGGKGQRYKLIYF